MSEVPLRKNIPVCTARVRHSRTTSRIRTRLIASENSVSDTRAGALIPDKSDKSDESSDIPDPLFLSKSDDSGKSGDSGLFSLWDQN